MTGQPEEKAGESGGRAFRRKVVDVRKVFHEAMSGHLKEGRIADKEKLEQTKLKISASLVNFVVNGGVLMFASESEGAGPSHEQLEEDRELTGDDLFHLLRETIFRMLNELNKPDVNLLKISLGKEFRECLQRIFGGADQNKFPVKIFQDYHQGKGYYIGINMRNTRSVGDDIDRIESDSALKAEIVEGLRSCRHTDGNLMKLFSQDPADPGTAGK